MEQVERKIQNIDADGRPLGRIATEIAMILMGKTKATYEPSKDEGDYVVVANCAKIKFTGKKLDQKVYQWHTTHPGGLRTKKVKDVFATNPGEVLKRAVWSMLPKNKLRDRMIKRLTLVK